MDYEDLTQEDDFDPNDPAASLTTGELWAAADAVALTDELLAWAAQEHIHVLSSGLWFVCVLCDATAPSCASVDHRPGCLHIRAKAYQENLAAAQP